MGFMGGIFRALGFESESSSKRRKRKTKASYKLKNDKNVRPNQIDGVPVYYPESLEQTKEFLEFLKGNRAIIISVAYCDGETAMRSYDYACGLTNGLNAKMIALEEKKLYLLLPEGMEVEE